MALVGSANIAVSLDGGYVQILQARKKGKSMVIDQAVLEPMPKTLELKEKADILQEMWRTHGLKGRDVVLVVPRSLWTVKMVTVPSSARETIQQVMELNIEQYLPFSMAESLWDWEVLRQGPGEESVVLLMAMRKQDFDERMQILEGAHLHLAGIEVSSVGLLNLVDLAYPNLHQQRAAFVDLQHGWVDVLVVDRGEMTFSRGIELPKGLEAIPTWVGEVRHTLIAYDQNHPLGKIEKVIVVGSEKMLSLLREKHFEEPIQRPYQPLAPHFEGAAVPSEANIASHCGPLLRSLGVATKAFHLSKAHERVAASEAIVRRVPLWTWAAMGCGVLLAAGATGLQVVASQKAADVDSLKAQVKKMEDKPKNYEDVWDQFLHVLDSRIPGVWFDNIRVSPTQIMVSVKAETIELAYDFVAKIKKRPGYVVDDNLNMVAFPITLGPGGVKKSVQAFNLKVELREPKKPAAPAGGSTDKPKPGTGGEPEAE